ncbi:MAG: VOC family protein [Hoeflea sp.]|uniref:VOC family protein n=1 Tax=Hoeflea sp. TaxID=1940281 RepID=UPI0032ECFA75
MSNSEIPASRRGFSVSGLGEIAVRCGNFEAMVRFYRDVIGLEVLAERGTGLVFFRLGNGVEGHTAVLALFAADRNPDLDGPRVESSTLHHFALSLSQADQAAACRFFDTQRIPYRIEEFAWIGWRGVFLSDPDGNTVELVSAGWQIAP